LASPLHNSLILLEFAPVKFFLDSLLVSSNKL
jgi:hypothetical protein